MYIESKKHNQSIRKFAIKHDEPELIDLGQFLREAFHNIKVEREWFIVFDSEGRFVRTQERQPPRTVIYRHPDLMIFEKLEGNKKGKLLCCMEDDGRIHAIKITETNKRNDQYKTAKVPLLIIDKQKLDISIYNEAYQKLSEFLNSGK